MSLYQQRPFKLGQVKQLCNRHKHGFSAILVVWVWVWVFFFPCASLS